MPALKRQTLKPTLARVFQVGSDMISGWWISEKLDGVRGIARGTQLFSRNGLPIACPEAFTRYIPHDVFLDGELFGGRGRFAETSGTVRSQQREAQRWSRIKFCVFDIICPHDHGRVPYHQRYAQLKKVVKAIRQRGNHHIELVVQYPLQHLKDAERYYHKWLKAGGEGAVLRDPSCAYEHRRSKCLLKWKPNRDAEARVTGFTEGKGQYRGHLGAFRVQLVKKPSVKFQLSGRLSQADRFKYRIRDGKWQVDVKAPVKVGDVVTFTFMAWTAAGKPREPRFLRVRHS